MIMNSKKKTATVPLWRDQSIQPGRADGNGMQLHSGARVK